MYTSGDKFQIYFVAEIFGLKVKIEDLKYKLELL